MEMHKAHHSRVTEKDVTGIGVLWEAAMSRNVSALRLFCRLGAPSFGQPGGRGRKARRSFPGTPTPVRSALPIGVGTAVQQPQLEATIMSKRTCTPGDGHSLRIDSHFRLPEPEENRLNDARALLGLMADLALMAADGQRFSLTGNEFAATMRTVLDLLPDSRQLDYVPAHTQEVLQ